MSRTARVVAILATYNEERYIAPCLEHLLGQGVEVYLIDNCSTDHTLEVAERYRESGVIGIETLSREGGSDLRARLRRKEELADTLGADWVMHVDADEIRLPPRPDQTLAEALTEVGEEGYNVVDFQEFTFVPTRESPDHDHPEYQRTMRWYYPFSPTSGPRQMNAWQPQGGPVGLSDSGGHSLDFPGMKLYPQRFVVKHYLFLSVPHIEGKYINLDFNEEAVKRGWHGWRARLESTESVQLPSQQELRFYENDEDLDASNPRKHHITEEWAAQERGLQRWVSQKNRLRRWVARRRGRV